MSLSFDVSKLGSYFDHTILKSDATIDDINNVINDAMTYNFHSVCVNSCYVQHCYDRLKDSNTKVCAVIGFPLGCNSTRSKVFECLACIEDGAIEIDMVLNVGLLKSGKIEQVKEDLKAVIDACHSKQVICKVILEICLLNKEELLQAIECSLDSDADFIKTSTGFSTSGATPESIEILVKAAHSVNKFVKASGGIRDGHTALKYLNLGADRLGTSATVKIYNDIIEILKNPDKEQLYNKEEGY